MQRYKEHDYAGTDVVKATSGDLIPAPPYRTDGRTEWNGLFHAFGPIGYMLKQLHAYAVAMDDWFTIHTVGEVGIWDSCHSFRSSEAHCGEALHQSQDASGGRKTKRHCRPGGNRP